MTWPRFGAVLSAVLVACSLCVSSGSGASADRWVVTDVAKLAALSYPAFGYVSFVGTTSDDRIYWLSYGTKDGHGTRDLFEWQKGTISDLGTVPIAFGIVNDQGAVAGSDFGAPICPCPPPPPAHTYLWESGTVTALGTFGPYAYVAGLNDRGQVAESFYSPQEPYQLHAALWQNGTATDLGTLGGWTGASGLNDRGQVVGWSVPPHGFTHAFLWTKGKMTDLGTLRGDSSQAMALNGRGQVVGAWWTHGSFPHPRAFLWQNGKAADLGRVTDDLGLPMAINERGQVIRSRQGFLGANAGVLWQQGKTINLGGLGGGQTWPLAIDYRGQIVGTSAVRGSTLSDPKLRAFLWENGKMAALPGPPVSYYAATMSIDPAGTHIVAGVDGNPGQLLLWTRR